MSNAYYRKSGSASYIVREVHSVREREREREIQRERERKREKDRSDVTIVALKLAMSLHFSLPKMCTSVLAKSFALFFAKNLHLSPPPPPSCLDGAEFTLSVAENVVPFETVCILRTVKWRA